MWPVEDKDAQYVHECCLDELLPEPVALDPSPETLSGRPDAVVEPQGIAPGLLRGACESRCWD